MKRMVMIIGKKIDMKGESCGNLVVLSEHGVYRGHDVIWLCRCNCGNLTAVRGSFLRSGHTKSCGQCPEKYEICDGFVKCTIGNGRSFIFDCDDLAIVRQYRWSVDKTGYVIGTHKTSGERVKLHRLLLDNPKGAVVDHIDGNPADNRKQNLRIATQHQNTQNSAKPKSNTTGYKGVCFEKRRGKYVANIHPNGSTKFLGYFDNPIEAAIAYDKAALLYFGEFARLNFPEKSEMKEEKIA